jgi:hypothetical protein
VTETEVIKKLLRALGLVKQLPSSHWTEEFTADLTRRMTHAAETATARGHADGCLAPHLYVTAVDPCRI